MKPHVQKVPVSQQASFMYRVKADARFARGWHFHPEYELTYILRSQGRRFVGDTVCDYGSGDLVLLGPDLPHTWRSRDVAGSRQLHRAIVIQFREAFLGDVLWKAPEMRPLARLLERSSRGVAVRGKTRDEAARRMAAMRDQGPLERLLELFKLLDLLSRGGSDLREICARPFAPPSDPRVSRRFDRVLAHIDEQYAGPLPQARVAALADMTPAGFSRFFRRSTGRTFVAYVGELRVARACKLLAETDLSVLDVSLRSGFVNLANFNRRFRKLRGMSPREYRASLAGAS